MKGQSIRCIFIVAASLLLPHLPVSAEVIKVGVILPLSGPLAEHGMQIARGMQLFMEENSVVPGKHKIEPIFKDSRTNANIAKELTIELIKK